MNYYIIFLFSALDDLRRNKIRTFLTSLGIMIGVLSVVLLIAFGVGLRNYIQNQFDSLGTNLIFILPGKVITEGGGFQDPGALGSRFDERDVARLKRLPNIDYVVPVIEKSSTLSSGQESQSSQILATTHEIAEVMNLEAEFGNLLTKSDIDKRARKAVLGPKIAEDLFGSKAAAVGRSVRISNQSFTVIGVVKSKGGGSLGGPNFDSISYIPYRSSITINPDNKFYTLYIRALNKDDIPQMKFDIERTLLKRYEEDEFQVVEQTEVLNIVTNIFSILNMILVAIGSISLVVGGIGIMNIMYASVTERIKEIGIRRALGATREDILLQFLTQAVVLSIFGGLVGLIFAGVIVLLIQPFFPAEINPFSVFMALVISTAIGVFFGVFPAKKAADLSPMEAIRYE